LTVGSLSDHMRPLLVASLLAATGTFIFWTADGVASLLTARVVQSLAAGTSSGALSPPDWASSHLGNARTRRPR
jgi:hypothetical protein